jgi:hypothetical protein
MSPVAQHDRLLRTKSAFASQQRLGESGLDVVRRTGGPFIDRSYLTTIEVIRKILPTDPDAILCSGAALVRGPDGIARHVRDWNDGVFGGIAQKMLEDNRVLTAVVGVVTVSLPGAQDSDCGRAVYVTSPDGFSLKKEGLQFGTIIHVLREQPLVQVLFAAAGETAPAWTVVAAIGPRRSSAW